MAIYGLSGVEMEQRKSLTVGALAAVFLSVAMTVWASYQNVQPDAKMRVEVVAEHLGDGIVLGSAVRLAGLQVGTVEKIESAARQNVRIILALDQDRVAGITDTLAVTAAPGNLFGISELELNKRSGGSPLVAGSVIELTGRAADRMTDATMGVLLRQVGETTSHVLTPQLAETLRQVSSDLTAFTPLLEAIVVLGRTLADGQRYTPSYLTGQYAAVFAGTPPFVAGSIQLLDSFNKIDVLRTDREAFDNAVAGIAHEILPAVTTTSSAAQEYLGPYATLLTPLLHALGRTVPTPQQSSDDVKTLLARIDSALTEGPGGPALNLGLTISSFPVLSSALTGPGEVGR